MTYHFLNIFLVKPDQWPVFQSLQVCANSEGAFSCICEGLCKKDADGICVREITEATDKLKDSTPVPTQDTSVCASSCWTRECDFCSNKTTCGLKFDLESNSLTIM